jgi:hypothetical protein
VDEPISIPFRPRYSRLAKTSLALVGIGLVAPIYCISEMSAHNHSGGMSGLGYAGLFVICLGASVIMSAIAAAVASVSRWRGHGEAQAALVAVGAVVGVPVLSFAVLASLH